MSNLSVRTLFSFALVAVVGLAGRSVGQPATEKKTTDLAHQQHYWDCAKACDDCARMCDACGAHCAKMVAEGNKGHEETMRTCQDCASVCRAAGAVTARTGPFSHVICTACAEVCKKCGDACTKHAAHDNIMKKCADECVACEKACREMLKYTHHESGTGTGGNRDK
jgi:Domain of Unknown Function (DUF326)